eukprot:COSAG01_NODE_6865_length_3464_cov_50.271620_6_plen_140_part_00
MFFLWELEMGKPFAESVLVELWSCCADRRDARASRGSMRRRAARGTRGGVRCARGLMYSCMCAYSNTCTPVRVLVLDLVRSYLVRLYTALHLQRCTVLVYSVLVPIRHLVPRCTVRVLVRVQLHSRTESTRICIRVERQ